MRKIYLLLLLVCFSGQVINAQSDCSNSVTVCGNTQPFNPSGVGSKLEQLACGGIEHNSIWITFQAKASGKLAFVIRPFTPAGLPTTADFDWSLYQLAGPPNGSNCDAKTQLSCNFAGTATVFGIPGATGMANPPYSATAFNPSIDVVSGTWYALIVDQFANNTPLLFSVQFTGNPEYPGLNSGAGIFDNRPDFSIAGGTGCNGVYTFTNSSAATGGIASYSWDFGDGSTSTAANPTKTYATPGTYFVTLTVTDNNGCKADIRKQVTYNNTPPTMNAGGILTLPSCTDGNTGSLTIVSIGGNTLGITGGTQPYTYELVAPSPMIRASQSSNVFTGLQPGTYTIKATDACGKSVTINQTVAQVATNSTIGLGIQNIQSACGSTPTGTATIFANGTVPPYTMQLVTSSPVTTGVLPAVQRDAITSTYFTTFNNLLPGSYTVEATDACGKVRRATFTVTASTAPSANTIASPSCATSPTGTLTVSATAATGLSGAGSPGTYQYALIAPSPVTRPFQTSSVFETLWPGTYTVAVRDACGNIGTVTATVNSAIAPTFGTAFTTLSCPNGATGTIEAQINTAGGGSPYTFELIAPSPVTRPAQVSNAFENLPPAVYTIRLTDACGSQVTSNVTVSAATAPTFTTTIGGSCTSPASGTITVAPGASSIGPYTFELISPGAAIRPAQGSNIANTTNSIFTGLDQGGYTIRMTDGCGVPVTNTATVGAPTALTFPAGSSTLPSCAAGSTGQITVAQPTTGLAAYKYELIAPSPVTVAPQYSRIFNNLPPGNYTVRITDSCGTQVTIGTALTVGTAATPTLSVTNTSSCATASGTITALTGTNQGGGTYQFALVAPSPVTRPNQSSPIFTGLPAGTYTVQITDGCGATGVTSTTIATAGAFSPAAGGSVVSCNGNNYNAQIIVTNPQNYTVGGPIPPGSGGGPFTYALYNFDNTVQIVAPQSSNIFSIVVPVSGNPSHTVRVTDACGNTSTATLAVNPPTPLSNATISATTASCAASATGVIKVTTIAAGGFTPYTYTLIDANTSAVVMGPQSGTTFNNVPANATGYFVRTTDACGNTVTTSVALAFPAAATPTLSVATTPSCTTPASGRIVATQGTGATMAGGTFMFALYDAANTVLIAGPQASPAFTSIAPGTYTVRIIDRCGNIGTASATVSSTVTAPTAAGVASGTCTGGSNGVITGSSTGGSLPISYTLVNQVTTAVVAGPQASNIFTGLPVGTYIVRVTDACGTVANSTDITLNDLTSPPTITTTSALDCSGSAVISAYGAGGSGGNYTYAMCTGTGCNTFGAFGTSSTFTVTSSGTYRIAVRDRCGNQVSSTDIAVTIPTKPVISGVSKANTCGTTTITPSFSGVANTPFYSIDGANFSGTLPSIPPGCHTIRIADNNAGTFGCASDAFDFSVFGTPTLNVPSTSEVDCTAGTVRVTLNATGGSLGCVGAGTSYAVRLASCVGCTGGADPIGTTKASGSSFTLIGAASATFAPVIRVGASELCAGTALNLNFVANYCAGGTLPITIEYFRGYKNGSNHNLTWKVNCTNSPRATMTLERSADGRNFTDIYSITAEAARCLQPFDNVDASPLNGLNYYRLKMVDADGKVTYSTIIALLNRASGFDIVGIIPNPVPKSGNAILNVTSAQKGKLQIVVTDMAGKQLLSQVQELIAGSNPIAMKLQSLSAGVYQITAHTSDGSSKTVRFVKE